MQLKTNDENECPHTVIQLRNQITYTSAKECGWKEYCPCSVLTFLIFVFIIPQLFFFLKQFLFSYRFANNTLFSFALSGGTLCKRNHTKYIIQRLAALGIMFLRFIHTDVYSCSSCFCTAVKYCIAGAATDSFSILSECFFTDIWKTTDPKFSKLTCHLKLQG